MTVRKRLRARPSVALEAGLAKRTRVAPWVVLVTVACEGGQRAETRSARAAAPPQRVLLLNRSELDAYAAAAAVEIGWLRKAMRSGLAVDWRALDSAAAAAAGMSADRLHAVSVAVEAALQSRFAPGQPGDLRLAGEAEWTFARDAARLDSLRIDLMMLRIRARGFP